MKKCIYCKIEQPLDNYYKKKSAKDGLYPICKKCRKDRYDPVKMKEYNKIYYKDNRDRLLEINKSWNKNNIERVRIKKYEWRKNNPDKVKAYDEKYREKHIVQRKLQYAIRMKRIIKKNVCSNCGKSPTECHHPDYKKPFYFIELCRQCHKIIHQGANPYLSI